MRLVQRVQGVARQTILALALVAAGLPGAALAQQQGDEGAWRHGAALLGEPSYPEGFPHFAYVNPDAPKGGLVRFGVQGAFDSFNLAVADVRGDLAAGIGLIYETLMTSSLDEVGAEYGLIAEAMRHPADYSSVTYRLNPAARWHDGTPVTVADVIWSFEILKANSPSYNAYYANVIEAREAAPGQVQFLFSEVNNRELPQIVGQLPILPKHWWEGTGPDGRQRDVTRTTLEPPLGSGPYRLASFVAGRSVVYARVPDYWGADLNVNVGKNNFDEIRFEYFRDGSVLLEAFKGDQIDGRTENIARNWATAYDFPAVREGRVVLEEFPIRSSAVMQAFVFNLRRAPFNDERVRRAFNLAFDFESINRTIFFGQYVRLESFFHGTELAATGLPEGLELEILEGFRGRIPDSVFTTPYTNPTYATAEQARANQMEALRLLGEAGFERRGREMVNRETGQPLRLSFVGFDPSQERYLLPYRQALARLGIGIEVSIVDPSRYENLVREFNFDVITNVWAQSLSPGNEQRNYWGSAAANRPGSRNLAGIADQAIDALIERVIFARDRDELVAATRALDRVLLAHHFVVPQWTSGTTRTARWDRFSRPETMPEYGMSAFPMIWWFDPQKAAASRGRQ